MENRRFSSSENEDFIVNNSIISMTEKEDVENDFEKLLDQFIASQLNGVNNDTSCDGKEGSDDSFDGDEEEGGDYSDDSLDDDDNDEWDDDIDDAEVEKLILTKVGEYKYYLPEPSLPLCCADKLFVLIGNYETQLLRGEPLVFDYSDCNDFKAYFSLDNLYTKDNYKPLVYIYAMGSKHRFDECRFLVDEGEREAVCTLSSAIEELMPGNYFFLIKGVEIKQLDRLYKTVNGCYCIPFVIVSSKEHCPPATLQKTTFSLHNDGYSITINTTFERALEKDCAFTYYMYNGDYNLISRGASFVCDNLNNRKRKKLSARLTVDTPLFGSYSLFMLQNGVPYRKIELNIDDNRVEVFAINEIPSFGQDYLMLTELEKMSSWHIFRDRYMARSVKSYFLARYSRILLNKLRKSNTLNVLATIDNFVYNGGYSKFELDNIEKLCDINFDIKSFNAVDCISLTETKSSIEPYSDATELFDNCVGKCIALYNISALLGCAVVVNKLLDALKRSRLFVCCLIGSSSEVRQLFEACPGLVKYFPSENLLQRDIILSDSLVLYILKELNKLDLYPTVEAQKLLIKTLKNADKMGNIRNWCIDDVTYFVKNGIVDNFVKRTLATLNGECADNKEFLSTVEACDINCDILLKGCAQEFEESIKALNKMVGLDEVKRNIITTFNRIKNNAERRRLGLKVKDGECHHMIFTGNPGTGKTTVAKMVGRIYRALGILSKGDVIYTDRSKIVGRFIGDTEHNMQCLLSEAKGNVLFIDEAYTLCDSQHDRKDFGYRAIECLLPVLAQDSSDMIVIFAGYKKEMDEMMQSNQGLSGRFPYKFLFKDYSAEELMQIAECKFAQEDYELSCEARELLRATIDDAVNNKEWDFSNARWVEQYVNNGIIPAQCDRLTHLDRPVLRDDYRLIEVEDIRVAFLNHKPAKRPKKQYREIGFIAS